MPTGSVMPTISAVSTIALPSASNPMAASRTGPAAPRTLNVRRSPAPVSMASSVPSPPSAIGQRRTVASGRARITPAAMACATCSALSEPLKESGAMTTTGADDGFGMVSLDGWNRCDDGASEGEPERVR